MFYIAIIHAKLTEWNNIYTWGVGIKNHKMLIDDERNKKN